jgi:hypothetical protein
MVAVLLGVLRVSVFEKGVRYFKIEPHHFLKVTRVNPVALPRRPCSKVTKKLIIAKGSRPVLFRPEVETEYGCVIGATMGSVGGLGGR